MSQRAMLPQCCCCCLTALVGHFGRLAALAGWQAVVVRRAEGLTYFHVLLHTRFPHQMALNAGVHTHDISILTTSSSSCAALKETSINELANYKSLVQCYIQKGTVPSNHRERFKIWYLIIQFVEDVSAGRSRYKIGIVVIRNYINPFIRNYNSK